MNKSDLTSRVAGLYREVLLRWPSLSYATLPIVIFVFVMSFSAFAYVATSANLEAARSRTIVRKFHENELRVNAVFESYANLLLGSKGLMQSGVISKENWQKFIDVYDIGTAFDEMEAVGVIYGDTPKTTSLTYVHPVTPETEQFIGLNIADVKQAVPSIDQSARSDTITITNTLAELFSTKSDISTKTNGFLMLSPFYDESLPKTTPDEQLQAFRGYTAALFRGDVLFSAIFQDLDLQNTDVEVYLGKVKPENLMYKVNNTDSNNQRTAIQSLTEFGNTFTFVYRFDTNSIVPMLTNYTPQLLLIGGFIAGVLIASIAGYLLRNRYRNLQYQNERDIKFAKDELLSLASHQLRTPATGVKQYLGMVLQGFAGELNDQQRIYLERAYSSNNRQLHVINDILHLAKLEAGRIILSEHKFDLADMVREVIFEQKEEARKGEIKLELQAPPRGLIVGDSHMLRMVVENLVNNAIKYTPPGGLVTVRLSQRGKSWLITVKDTGVGIANKDLSKLFKQFSRINNSRSDHVTGTGIGLYLSHHLVILHGGTISVTSHPGKGSVFTVRLPKKM